MQHFITNLCDDIYITRQALTKPANIANMYITTRQRSQGRQESYNCSDIMNESDAEHNMKQHVFRQPMLQRQQTSTFSVDEYEEYEDIESFEEDSKYVFSQNIFTPYATQNMVKVMRSVSGNRDV